jgi:amino acid transporter
MSFSFCYSSIAVITSLCLVINFGLETGGPVVMIWGWIMAFFFTLFTVLSMAEICSVYPSAGSVYYWTGMLSPSREWAPVLSYICAWFNLLGNIACDSSFAFGLSQILSALVSLMSNGQRELSIGAQVAVSILVLALWALKNRMRLDKQGWFSNTSAVYQLLSTILITIIIVLASPELSSHDFVFTTYHNDTGFPKDNESWVITAYICSVGVLMSLYGLSGYDSGATMSEETASGATAAPKGMIEAVIASSITGFIFILGLLYAC